MKRVQIANRIEEEVKRFFLVVIGLIVLGAVLDWLYPSGWWYSLPMVYVGGLFAYLYIRVVMRKRDRKKRGMYIE